MAAKKFPILLTDDFFLYPKCDEFLFIENDQFKKEILVNSCEKSDGYLLIVPNKSQTKLDSEKHFTRGVLAKIALNISDAKSILNQLREVQLQGLERVKLTSVKQIDGIYWGECEILAEKKIEQDKMDRLIEKFVRYFPSILEKTKIITEKLPHLTIVKENISRLIDFIAQKSKEINKTTKWEILVSLEVEERLDLLINFPDKKQIEKKIEEETKSRIKEHQDEYYLREKLKVIKKKLGEAEGTVSGSEIEKILARLEKEPYPEYVKKVVREEIKRYETMFSSSSEANVVKQYIDYVMNIPWWQKTPEISNLDFARQKLNEKHYGLEEIKEKIIEHLAVRERTQKSVGQIICLVGPPGVGKTSLAASIAEAMGRKFIHISVGGVRDVAEIRGHRRTYIGAMPGRIIQSMKKSQVINPLFLIDEIDKIAYDYQRGDPASALLEVLDPKQNKEFIDDYLGNDIPYDLSQVMFICTANSTWNLPRPLLDRMEIITLYSYTENEKLHIAKGYLIPENCEKCDLSSSQIKFQDEAIKEIIKYYTREAGVRELNRLIQKIIQKFILQIAEKKLTKIIISPAKLIKYLKKKKYEFTSQRKLSRPGVATGLAYTGYGGDILPIEVIYYPRKEGEQDFTGSLGDVMKESCRVAISYLREKAKNKEFGLSSEIFSRNSIHIHVPEAATPKEGPSAGIALTSAIISALTGQVIPFDIGMTGEITLHGHVEAIGGLKEKAIAAQRNDQLKTIIIPKDNEKDIEDIPKEVRQGLTIITVKNYEEVWKILFDKKKKRIPLSPLHNNNKKLKNSPNLIL